MNKEEIDELRLLTLPKKYTYMTNEEFAKIKEGFKDLQSQLTKSNEKIEKIKEKCRKIKGQYDFGSWVDLSDSWKTLEDFNKNIEYNLQPIITYAFQCDIKNSINKVIEYGKYQAVKKDDILSIIDGSDK